jgi:hypothetical protein
MIDEIWEGNNPGKITTQVKSKRKYKKAGVYKTYEEVHMLTNVKDGDYYLCDWCKLSDEVEQLFFKTEDELLRHFIEKHGLLGDYNLDEICVSKNGVVDSEFSLASDIADEILKKKGLNIDISEDDAVNIAINSEIDADL